MNKEEILQKSLFNVPFWPLHIKNFKEKKKKLIKLLESYPEEKRDLQEFFTNRQSNKSGLVGGFESIMSEELEVFRIELKSIQEKNIAITHVWSVSYVQGDSQTLHHHGITGLTGILYLDLPKDSPSTLFLQPWNDITSGNTWFATNPVVEGDIIIVPSFVLHLSPPNKSENKKRVISWDMTFY